MSGLYIFSLVVGLPILLWMAVAGDGEADGGFDVEGDGPLSAVPISSIAFFLTAFGAVGLAGDLTGVGSGVAFASAIILAVIAAIGSRYVLKALWGSSVSSDVADVELEGRMAKASLPISAEYRGKIVLEIAGAREQMTASPVDGSSIGIGEDVVIVQVEKGVAIVAPLGPTLEIE